jgi:hypothetical protein
MDKRDAVSSRLVGIWLSEATSQSGGRVDAQSTWPRHAERVHPGATMSSISSIELHEGLDVADFSDSIPPELFEQLFPRAH